MVTGRHQEDPYDEVNYLAEEEEEFPEEQLEDYDENIDKDYDYDYEDAVNDYEDYEQYDNDYDVEDYEDNDVDYENSVDYDEDSTDAITETNEGSRCANACTVSQSRKDPSREFGGKNSNESVGAAMSQIPFPVAPLSHAIRHETNS